jgi:hypothetical protein
LLDQRRAELLRILLDGRTVARNEFAEKLEHAQKDLNGGWDRKYFDGAKQKAVARLILATAIEFVG